jgi:hypothetical protein
MHRSLSVSIIAVHCLMLSGTIAYADAIDGKWCNGAKSFKIEGPTITMPSGHQHQGTYNRHGFDYVVPDSEANAGERIQMTLQSDDLLNLQRAPKEAATFAPTEQWRRCVNIS